MYKYGGLYADLDVFPNLEKFPLVSLGLCKMLAMPTKPKFCELEWEIKVVVATAGNPMLRGILKDLSKAMATERTNPCWITKACPFVYHTTGPKQVGRTVESRGYEPQVTVFSICRPVPDLEKHLSLDDTGRVCCHRSGLDSYDVWSAFSMSYNTGDPRSPPPFTGASDLALARRPPFSYWRMSGRRYYVKTTKAPAAEVEQQTIAGYEPHSSES